MLDAKELNELATTAVGTAIQLYQGVEGFQNNGAGAAAGAIIVGDPRSMLALVKVMVTDLHALTKELKKHAQEGGIRTDAVVTKYDKVADKCRGFDRLMTTQAERLDRNMVVRELEEIMDQIEDFLEDVSATCKELQLLRDRSATTWQGVTAGAGIAVAGGAAALCVLAGPALPVLAPLVAAGLSFTGVAVTSHVAFTPTIGNQIANMDGEIEKLSLLKRTMAHQRLKATSAHGALTQGGASSSSSSAPRIASQGGTQYLTGPSNSTMPRIEEI